MCAQGNTTVDSDSNLLNYTPGCQVARSV